MWVSILLALMTGAAVLAVLWPLARREASPAPSDMATDTAFYRAQLREIDRDADRGLIEPGEAEAARIEAARRLLAAARRDEAAEGDRSSQRRRRLASAFAIVAIPVVAMGVYLKVGSPGLPGQPLAARGDLAPEEGPRQALARMDAHLAAHPEDGAGHEVAAPVYLRIGRIEDALNSFKAALRILGETPTRLENLAEARVAAADGVVTAEARAGFERALALDPSLVRSRFYQALAAEQDGRTREAVAGYDALARDTPPGSPLATSLAQRIKRLGGTPSASPGDAIAALGAKDRDAAIRAMVANLDARLAADGGDVEGWLRLVRSYVVLGEGDQARAALGRARVALAGDGPARERLEALARELGIGGS